MGSKAVILVIAGMSFLVWGFRMVSFPRRLPGILGAAAACIGLISALLGGLLVFLTDFFRG